MEKAKGLTNRLNNRNTFYAVFACIFITLAILCTAVLAKLFNIPTHSEVSPTETTTTTVCEIDNTETTTSISTTDSMTSMTTTTTTITSTETACTTTECIVTATTTPETVVVTTTEDRSCRMVYDAVHKVFSRGTYYCYPSGTIGGSGRTLIDCSVGDGIIKGSVASNYLYHELGYNLNGNRTVVYVEVPDFPEMNGLYYVDDCSAPNDEIIDFFYTDASHCPFDGIGVVTVKCYLINEEY